MVLVVRNLYPNKQKQSVSEEKKALLADYEHQLQKHENKYSRFQIKIWAEALDSRQYSDLDTPPGYAMFGQEKDKKNF